MDVTARNALTEFDGLPIPGAVCELDGTVLAVNHAAMRLLSRPANELVGNKVWDIAPGAQRVWSEVVAAAQSTGEHRGEIAIDTRVLSYVLALRAHAGRTVAVVLGLANEDDVGGQRKPPVDALALVAGGIAHDFNNQLVSVLAEASAARDEMLLGEASREALRRIEAAAHRMAQLTRQLLAYAGRAQLVAELLDPDELVRHAHEQLARTVRSDAELEIAPNAGKVAVEADRSLLHQVVVNLVTNASEALGASGGRVVVSTGAHTRDGRTWWKLVVADTGGGMDPATQARIFDPFFTTKSDRHGLGLSAVQGIVRRLQGQISVESRVGTGTTIEVQLPVIKGAVASGGDVRPSRTSSRVGFVSLHGQRVLVADDEPSVRATIKRLLERRGATVVTAVDGAEAEQALYDGAYTLVVLDVMMPHKTGYQLLPIARARQPAARVLVMSGYTEHTRGAGGEEEPDKYLEKPFTAKAFDQAVDLLLRR